jgi:hypothetical protein
MERNKTMKLFTALTAAAIAVTAQAAIASDGTMAQIEKQVTELCGSGDVGSMVHAGAGDVSWTENGFHIADLDEIVPFDDERLVFTDARSTYLCTQGAAGQETLRWLFIPRQSLF